MAASKKMSTLWHISKPNGLPNKISYFFLISLFLVPLADTLLAEPSPEIFNWGLHVCAEG